MKRTYIAAALLACTGTPAMAADSYYYTSAPSTAVVPSVQYYYQDQADIISTFQQRLRAEGYSVPVNGIFDWRTSDALKDFQRRQGLAMTGAIDQPTMAVLAISSLTPIIAVPAVVE